MAILVVDDSKDDLILVKSFLKSAGYAVITAPSAEEAFALLGMTGAPPAAIDLILLDLRMPGTDGIEACRRIKAVPRLREVPILMASAVTDAGHVQLAYSGGSVDYIRKPVIKMELLAKVGEALRLRKEIAQRRAQEKELLDVTKKLEQANEQLHAQSTIDALTGLPSRRHFERMLNDAWGRAKAAGQPFSLILLELDSFKSFNDTYGVQTGDDSLARVGRVIVDALDGQDQFAGRLGGAEFALALAAFSASQAVQLADQVRATVGAIGIGITVTMGVATADPKNHASPAELIAAADQALFRARHAGQNWVHTIDLTAS
jgi:diguanylate cyclase (GGDEF)-like protein